MNANDPVTLTRDVEAAVVPVGTPVTLLKGEQAYVTQSLGGSYTVIVNGNMFRISGQHADALGFEQTAAPASASAGSSATPEQLEKQAWDALRTCYDPEIPVNIVDLGLVYDCAIEQSEGSPAKVQVKMTLTAPGCGMGPTIAAEARQKVMSVDGVGDAAVDLVWDPPWNQAMISEAGKMKLGLI